MDTISGSEQTTAILEQNRPIQDQEERQDQQQQQDEQPEDTSSGLIGKTYHRTRLLWSQLTLPEISGSLGDLGTLIPLLVALARKRSIHLAPALFFGGLANVLTGFAWDVPMCVQPMKSISAVAIAEGLTQTQVTAAGIWMGIFMTLLGGVSLRGVELIDVVNRVIPLSVVSGLQMGVGLNLAIHGVDMIRDLGWANQADCMLTALLVSIPSMYWLRESSNRPHPVGVYLFLLGLVLALIKLGQTHQLSKITVFHGSPIVVWSLSGITSNDWKNGLTEGAIPQLPLTTLNSVISVCCLARSLYPNNRITRKEVAVSVGIMNLLMCPFGAMPNCHGAGGLAGQYRFGARHGTSVVFLGCCKMLLALVFGASALVLLDSLPNAILGVMLTIAGQELASTGLVSLAKQEPQERLRQRTVVAMITTLVILGAKKTHYGALAGWITYMVYGDGLAEFLSWIRGYNRQESQQTEGASQAEQPTNVV